ncbi:reverse transcriptase domain-containing protein, partial [Tanacetum coccineum]
MEEMLYKFIDEGRREHEEIGSFIREFKTTNELLLKERNNSLSELEFEVYGLSKAINNAQSSNYEVKGVTTRGGKTTTEISRDTNNISKEPPILHHDKPVEPNEVLVETKPQETKEQTIQPSTPSIPFPHRLEEACTVTMNERCSAVLLNKLPSKEKDTGSFTIPCDIGHLHINNALADLGASISLMPYTMYEKLGLEEPKPTRMSLELADRSIHNMEESIDLSDLESYDKTDYRTPIRRIEEVNTPYSQETKNEHLYSASANKIDEKRPVLKDLPSYLEYAYQKGDESCPVIISSKLTEKEKVSLLEVLEKCKGAIAWKMSDIKGISPSFCTHKILMEESFKPVIQPQRRLNSKVQDVVKNKIVKLLDSGLIYPISDSPWMLERLSGNEYYCFLDGFSRFFQIPIAPEDQEKTTFTCPYGTVAYRRMPFGLCNAPATFQRCMMVIFHDMVEDFMEVFMDDFSVFGNSFDQCLNNLDKMLGRCEETNLVLNWEKCHFMVKEGIVLGHKISRKGIEVDKAKIDVIAKLPYPSNVKGVRSFLGHAGFYR